MSNPTRAALAAVSVQAGDLAEVLSHALVSSGHDTSVPGEVVAIIDQTLHELHQIRDRAIVESRRRLDAAMARSAALLEQARTTRGLVR